MPLLCIALLGPASAGCHTIDAGRRLAAPSPAWELALSLPDPSQIDWRAKYGESAYPDAWPVALFVRSVENHGAWRLPDGTRPCALHGAMSAAESPVQAKDLASHPVTLGDGYWLPSDLTEEHRNSAIQKSCSHLIFFTGHGLDITGIELLPPAEGVPLHLSLPRERPWADPRRWGWLVVAPLLDAVTVVAAPPILLFVVAADATNLQ